MFVSSLFAHDPLSCHLEVVQANKNKHIVRYSYNLIVCAYMCVHTLVIITIKTSIKYMADNFNILTFSNDCSYDENLRDATFYRHVIVFTPFAATALGLASICLLALYQYCKRRKVLQIEATSAQDRTNIQISESNRNLNFDVSST